MCRIHGGKCASSPRSRTIQITKSNPRICCQVHGLVLMENDVKLRSCARRVRRGANNGERTPTPTGPRPIVQDRITRHGGRNGRRHISGAIVGETGESGAATTVSPRKINPGPQEPGDPRGAEEHSRYGSRSRVSSYVEKKRKTTRGKRTWMGSDD